jgi:hypothetical protein
MSTTTKSPKQLAAAAYRIARGALPEYNSRYSPRKFTQPQLLVCLVLKTFFNTDYRGIVQILDDWPSLCTVFELKTVPHFTTLQKASHRLLKSRHARKLIECSVSSVKTHVKPCLWPLSMPQAFNPGTSVLTSTKFVPKRPLTANGRTSHVGQNSPSSPTSRPI